MKKIFIIIFCLFFLFSCFAKYPEWCSRETMKNIKIDDIESNFYDCKWKIYIDERYHHWILSTSETAAKYVKAKVDDESFEVLSRNYAKDKNNIYKFYRDYWIWFLEILNNWADVSTFKSFNWELIQIDKNNVFYRWIKKENIDSTNFQKISENFYKNDENIYFIWYDNINVLDNRAHRETFFSFYWDLFQKDKNFIYFNGYRDEISDKIDIETFRPYEMPNDKNKYFIDKNHTYIVDDNHPITDVNFKIYIVWLNYKHIWNNYYSDNENVYFKYKILPELSVKSTLEDIKTYHYKKQIFSYHYLFKNKGLEFEEKIKKSKITALKEQKFWRDNFYIFYKFDEKNPDKKIISYDLSDFFDFDYNWKFEDIKFIDDFSFIAWENLYYKWKKIWKILKYLLKKSNLRLIYFADDNFYLIDEKDIYFKWNKKLEFVNNYYHNYWIFLVLNWKYVYYKWEKIFTYEKQKKLNDYYFKYFWVIKYENISEHFFRYEEKWKVFVLTEFNNWNKYNISEYIHENPNHLTDYSIEEYIKMKNYNLKQQKN